MKTFENIRYVSNNFTGVCKFLIDNSIHYYKNGKHHREDGPAAIYEDGTKYWILNGKSHRESGPSDQYHDGDTYWCYEGIIHGCNDEFTNETWMNKVKEIKREEEL